MSIRIRTKTKGTQTNVKVLMRHPMETGLRKDPKSGKIIPAHFIQEVTCDHNGKVAFTAIWGVAVSKNPYLSFDISNVKPGDNITVTWKDNKGKKDSKTVQHKG